MNFDPSQPWSGRVALHSVCRNEEQPRKRFSQDGLEKLGTSLKRRQQVPCPVIPYQDPKRPGVRWMLVDGERRWRAAQVAGLATLWVAYEPGVDAENLHESSLAANFCREGHTKMETALALQREIEAGKGRGELAEVLGKSEFWVGQYLALNNLVPELQELLDPPTPKNKLLPLAIGAALAGYPRDKQMALYRRHVMGRSGGSVGLLNAMRLSEGAAQRKVSNARYALGRIRAARAAVAELRVLRDKVVKEMTAAEAEQALVILDAIRTEVTALAVDLRCVK